MQFNFMTIVSIVLIAASVAIAIGMIFVSSTRDLTSLETILFQTLALGTGLSGSYIVGQRSSNKIAQDVMRLHARPAFRRVLELYNSLFRLSERIDQLRRQQPSSHLDVIQAIVDEQIVTGRSAIQDWHDIIPEDVNELIKQQGTGLENDSSD